jgi:hypothetical protein
MITVGATSQDPQGQIHFRWGTVFGRAVWRHRSEV